MAIANLASLPAANIISKKFLDIYLKRLTPLSVFTNDFTDEVSDFGKSVTTSYVTSIPTAATVPGSANSVPSNAFSLTNVVVTFGDPLVAQIAISEEDLIKVPDPKRLEDQIARVCAYSLAQSVQNACFNLITTGNYSNNVVSTAANFNYAAYSSLVAEGYALGMQEGEAGVVLSSPYIATLQNSQAIWGRTFSATTPAGSFGMDQGATIYRNDQIAGNAGQYVNGFMASKDAMVMINRALPTDSSLTYGQRMLIKGENGCTIRMSAFQDPNQNYQLFLRFETLFAVALGLTDHLVPLTSQ